MCCFWNDSFSWYPLVNDYNNYGKIHHFEWENWICLQPFSIATCHTFPEGPIKSHSNPIKPPFSQRFSHEKKPHHWQFQQPTASQTLQAALSKVCVPALAAAWTKATALDKFPGPSSWSNTTASATMAVPLSVNCWSDEVGMVEAAFNIYIYIQVYTYL